MYSSELFSLELLREKFENDLEISRKTQKTGHPDDVSVEQWGSETRSVVPIVHHRLTESD